MRVLIVSQYFWPESFRINDIVRSLCERGLEVDILTGKPNYPEGFIFEGYRGWGTKTELWNGATIYRVPLFARGARGAWRLMLNYLSFIVAGTVLGPWLLRKRQYDVIFVYGLSPILSAIPAVILSWIKRRKLIIWVQDLWPDSLAATGYIRNSAVLKIVEWMVRWIYQRADLLLVQSHAFQAPVTRLAPGRPIIYYPNSGDAAFGEVPRTNVVLPAVPALEEGFPIVFAGNIGVAQAVEVIVDAAKLLLPFPEIRLIIFGQGSRWDWMCEQVRLNGLTNLHLPGRFPVNTMPGLMQKAAVLLVTLADESIFAATVPSKVQAYLAAGRPILACLNGEGARLVEEAGAGLSASAENAQALADAVLRLYQMTPERRDAMGAAGRNYFKTHFDHDKLVDELMIHLFDVSLAKTKDAA